MELPDDILILIYSQCRIDDVLSLRLTNLASRDLIGNCFESIAPSVARSTFPRSERILASFAVLERPFTLSALKNLRVEALAAILVDRHRVADIPIQHRYGIPAEDPFGDALRARVVCGWRVYLRLSNISSEVHRGHAKSAIKTSAGSIIDTVTPSRFKLEAMKRTEDLVLQNRLQYIINMPCVQAQAYKNVMVLLSAVLNTSLSNHGDAFKPWPFDFGDGIDVRRALRKGETWFAWFLLARGPELFWKQWWNLPYNDARTQNYIRDCAIDTFKNTPTQLVDHQRCLAQKLQQAINVRALSEGGFYETSPFHDFAQYAGERQQREETGSSLAKETMDHVPFHICFRCPDDLVKQHEALRRGLDTRYLSPRVPR